jgi:hypothetical protein
LREPSDPLEDVYESGGELFLAVGYTSGGAPFGPRVEIVDGELVFPDEPPLDFNWKVGPGTKILLTGIHRRRTATAPSER